jgi:hypothetical protein
MNQLEVIFLKRKAVPDKRYRVLVNLQRSDRPRFWIAKCMNCGSNIADIQHYEIYSVADFYDPQSIQNAGVGRHCKGTNDNGTPCQYSYFFQLQ